MRRFERLSKNRVDLKRRPILLLALMAMSLGPTNTLVRTEEHSIRASKPVFELNNSPDSSIKNLQNSLLARPREEYGYLRLLENYQVHRQTSEAKTFFQNLAQRNEYRPPSLWMLAKLAACDSLLHTSEDALSVFITALNDTPAHSPNLIFDFVDFCHENFDSLKLQYLITQHLPDAKERALARGLYHYLNDEFPVAEQALRQALHQAPDAPFLFYVLANCILRNEASPSSLRAAQADSIARVGFEFFQRKAFIAWQARFSTQLGDIAYARDAYEQAQASYEKAYDLAQASREIYSLQRALAGLGKLQFMQNFCGTADSLYDEAIKLARAICAHRDLSLLYSNKCLLLNNLGNFSQALQNSEISERYARRAHDEEALVRIKIARARLYHDLRQNKYAEQLATEARDLARSREYMKLRFRANALLADIFAHEKKFFQARKLYDEYLSYLQARNNHFERHSYLAKKADTYRDEGPIHYERALALYQEAGQEAAKHGSEYYHAWYRLDIADLEIRRGNLEQAAQALASIPVEIFNESPEGFIRLKLSWGEYFRTRGEWERAISAYRAASMVIDSTRPEVSLDRLRVGYFSDRARAAQGLAECFHQRYQMRQALADRDSMFYYLERARGRSFEDLFGKEIGRDSYTAREKTLESEYLRACEALQTLQRRLRRGEAVDDSLRLETARYTVVYQRPQLYSTQRALPTSKNGIGEALVQAQETLRKKQAALLLYHIAEQASFMIAISGTDFRALPLRLNRAEIFMLCDTLMAPLRSEALRTKTVAEIKYRADLAYQLYEVLIKPAEDAMKLPVQLIIVPDAALASVPFEMFLTKPQAQIAYAPTDSSVYARDFLLQRYAFSYSPSFDLIKQNVHTDSPARGVLLLANPLEQTTVIPGDTSKRVLEPLPFTELEAKRIEDLYAHTSKFTRDAATQIVFTNEAAKHRVVHFATHAFVDSVFDDFSGLALAMTDDITDDGFLMGYEIAGQKLINDLIVLSACETGLGNVAEGEGVLGLPRLFLRAGAKSVLMTLWQVDDRFAAELVPRLYDYYLNDGLAKADALAKAKREILKKQDGVSGIYQQHPFYWAAFTLYGDPGQTQTSFRFSVFVASAIGFIVTLLALFGYRRFRSHKLARI